MYRLAKLEKDDAERMDANNMEAYFNANTDEYFTQRDLVPNQYVVGRWEIVEVTQAVVDGTYPINPTKPRRPVVPR